MRGVGWSVSALVAGGVVVGATPALVRVAEVAPEASAFWRVALALAPLGIWAWLERRARAKRLATNPRLAVRVGSGARLRPLAALAGLCFAGDLFFWHQAVTQTSMATATFLLNCSPVLVALGGVALLKERVAPRFWISIVAASAGGMALFAAPGAGSWQGNAMALAAAAFWGSYLLALRAARREGLGTGPGGTMFMACLITALTLGAAVIGFGGLGLGAWSATVPETWRGAVALCALAACHVLGQGLIVVGLRRVPVAWASALILVEGVSAAFVGWAAFGEALGWGAALGGAAVAFGGWMARPVSRMAPARSAG